MNSLLVLFLLTYVVVFSGPAWVLLFVEKSLLFCLLVIFLFLDVWQRLPLWTDSKAQTCNVFQGKTQTSPVVISPV